MGRDIKVLVFGDQSEKRLDDLRQLVTVSDNPLLTTFFDKAYITLREEVNHLPFLTKGLPGFTSIETLLWRYGEAGVRHPAIESALVCIHQIATLLRHFGDGSEVYPKPADTRLVASCTGLLSAAAVSCARTYRELVSIAVEALKLAFRVGAQVAQVCDEIEQTSLPLCWAAIFPGVGKEDAFLALEEYAEKTGIPPTSRPYVSATSLNSVTISAPPGDLENLIEAKIFNTSRPIRLPIFGPYHAPHFYNDEIVASLAASIEDSITGEWEARIPIINNGKHNAYESSNFRQLVEEVLEDILLKPLHWERLCDNCVASVASAEPEQCRVVPIGAKNASASLVNALNQKASFKIMVDNRKTEATDEPKEPDPIGSRGKPKIAIVGMAGRFPDAMSPSLFWDLLKKGLDVHREVPPDRFDAQAHYDPAGKRKNTSHTPYGCFIEHPGLFDSRFFNMSPKEAAQTDPMHRLALLTAYEALEMSGFVPNRTPSTKVDRVGTFYGQTSDDWREIQDGQNIQTYFIPGGVRAFAPGRINYHFGFSGPSFSVDTACSSSLAAINIACNSLWLGDCDTALAGGLNVLTNPDIFSGLSRGQFLSKTGNCKTFDDGADGYCRGDGAGTVILKRLEDAEADNDPILAVILGTGTNHSADAVSITHPHAGAQEYLFKKVLTESSLDPHDVSYVEMHGTGTQAGDAIEMESVLNAFAPASRQRSPDHPLYLGSVKANVGHGEAASGITALVKILLMLENNLIPPHCGIKGEINHNFPDLGARNVHISLGRETAWRRPEGGKRRFFLNNFSAAGGNTSLLMEDGAQHPLEGDDPRSTAVVAVAGKTKKSLVENTKNLIGYISENKNVDLPSLSYTTTARREHYSYRTIVTGSDLATIESALRKALDSEPAAVPSGIQVVFAFTGQGSHYTGMGRQLYETNSQFRADIRRFDLLARNQGLPAILPLVDGSTEIEKLGPVVVQTGAVCVQIALVRLWQSWGIKPAAVIGHSLGEYAALQAAGVLSINDAIFLTGTRAKSLEAHCTQNTHAMLSVVASVEEIEGFIDSKTLEIACINGPKATVISGESSNIDKLKEQVSAKGMKSTKLAVPFAFHSAQVEPALDDFESAAAGVTYNAPKIPLIAPLLSTVVTEKGTINAEYLRRHCREPVNFLGALQAAKEKGIVKDKSQFVEIGGHSICSGMVKSVLGSTTVALPSLKRDEDVYKTLTGTLCALHMAGLKINWNNYHESFPRCHHCLKLPTYAWDASNYWIEYENNWTLTKTNVAADDQDSQTKKLSTSTVQRIVTEKFQGQTGTLTTETDISKPELEETIKGHLVNGSALTSSAVYADMALTIGDYVHRKLQPEIEGFALNCANMVVEKPLIFKGGEQLLRVDCEADLTQAICYMTFYSVGPKGQKLLEHAHCEVRYGDSNSWSKELARQKYLVQSQVDRLLQMGQNGVLSRLQRKMAYKLFSALVDYQNAYKGMAEVILDSPLREGTARIELQTGRAGNFYMPPYHIDSLCHLAGFIMNANDELDSAQTVYVNHGWDSLRFFEKPSPSKIYRSYVRMQPTGPDSKDYSGDVFVFDAEGNIVGQIGGLTFQFLPKQVLDRVLPPAGGKATAAPAPAKKAASEPKKTAPKATAKPKVAPAGPTIMNKALNIMAEEIGVSVDELTDDTDLGALGVDSLMSLTISGKFREGLDIEIPSTLLADSETFKQVRDFLTQFESKDGGDATPSSPSAGSSDDSGSSTPAAADTESMTSASQPDEKPGGEAGGKLEAIRAAIAEETGMDPSEVTSDMDLEAMGIDSLMSLQILGILREDKDIDLPPSFFSDHATFGDIEKAMGGEGTQASKPKLPAKSEEMSTEQVVAEMQTNKGQQSAEPPKEQQAAPAPSAQKKTYKASSVLLQGNPKTATKTVFMFPDGSGCAISYATIPPISPKDVALVALNCPYMKDPEAFEGGIPGVTALYLEEIRRRQPQGPYILGGWSAGGICAYEACLQLSAMGESVEKLIYLDVPCPLPPQALPPRLHHFFDSIGLLGQEGEAPDWLIPHFTATIKALSSYRPRVMDPAKESIPTVYTVYAQDGVCKHDDDPRPELTSEDPPHMKWLLFNREDFGPLGWENLFSGSDHIVGLESIPNVNHFTMMREPMVSEIPSRIRKALGVNGDE
ncbi:Conidial yellow pigment biosynthesis polyketide synthase [Cladophialophora carrionii]|uniref:Conidial yellow pigment biosynthesis polyketide synthase n=1 Tax=Cladophialophora carrionii TaxID=86049 RepID=A0A1C1CHV5_9EURO|nr:Conidial yellow pigment biosynthesis polyketide synthase [Cladophialophora carrionii]